MKTVCIYKIKRTIYNIKCIKLYIYVHMYKCIYTHTLLGGKAIFNLYLLSKD